VQRLYGHPLTPDVALTDSGLLVGTVSALVIVEEGIVPNSGCFPFLFSCHRVHRIPCSSSSSIRTAVYTLSTSLTLSSRLSLSLFRTTFPLFQPRLAIIRKLDLSFFFPTLSTGKRWSRGARPCSSRSGSGRDMLGMSHRACVATPAGQYGVFHGHMVRHYVVTEVCGVP